MSRSLFATATINDRQAFTPGNAYNNVQNDGWRIYAFTDRPAYRPKETLQWKFIARQAKGGAYSTPANQIVEYVINDPRGTKVTSGKATLNAFGSAWGSLELGEQLPLGEYSITFWEEGYKQQIGGAKLFRLEEYKLPEFKVEVKTPEQDGKKKAFRVGEKVEVEIQADYYFGGPVTQRIGRSGCLPASVSITTGIRIVSTRGTTTTSFNGRTTTATRAQSLNARRSRPMRPAKRS